MSEISLPLNDFNISSPSLFPFLDLVITLPRQGFDFSSEEMSENNHFHRQLTLLAPLFLPHWMCSYPLLILFTAHFQTSHTHQQYLQIHNHIITTELYVHHYHVQYQIAKLLKINRLHHQPVGKSSHKSKTTKQPNNLKMQRGRDILSLLKFWIFSKMKNGIILRDPNSEALVGWGELREIWTMVNIHIGK